ncbi:putative bifunctional diguanylate cyclase/phosphodiesterase [Loktanella sp. R86503]|uniref:putative bifunctional diguanylate cyclase/phosphodiesterase n=1 Tax=Loktanella sp. R86503 TaxID=3093847 RepID=UPI0036DDCD07
MQVDIDQNAEISAIQQVISRNILLPLFENSGQAIVVLNSDDLLVVAANRLARTILNQGMRTLQRLTLMETLPNLPEDRVAQFIRQFIRVRRRSVRARVCINGDKETIYDVDIIRVPGPLKSVVVIAQDVTLTVRALRIAAKAESQMATAIDALSDGFVLYDADDRLVICNQTYRTFYLESAAAMEPGNTFENILRVGLKNGQYADGIGREEEWLATRLKQHRSPHGVIEQKLSNGRWLRIMERVTADGGRVGLRVDVTQLKEQQHALRRLAITDELTGLRNRRNLLEDIAQLADKLGARETVVVYHLDLDKFKAINDVYGHEAGDHVLKHCAAILESAVAPGEFAARVGGDEFIIVRRMPNDRDAIAAFADQIIDRMMRPLGYAGQLMHIGVSIGIALLELGSGMAARGTVLTAADLALYEAKKIGGVALFFEPSMRDQVLSANALARELQIGLERNEFEAYFQPQVDAVAGECIGFEALLRWSHPRRGVMNAGQFLDVAQRAGLTDALDSLMTEAACHALRWLSDQGMPQTSVSINMSTAQLSDPRMLSRLESAVVKFDIARHLLRIELLESTLLDERTTHFLTNVNALVKAGYVVELDDFGTGHAAIAALRKFHVSQIKIDRSFVRNIDTDVDLQKLTAAIIGLAHSLDISVLAEGVETIEEQTRLIDMGCRLAQGWYYGKAMPLTQIKDFLVRYPVPAYFRNNVSPNSIRGVS